LKKEAPNLEKRLSALKAALAQEANAA